MQKPADLSEMMVHKEPYIAPVPTPMVADEQKPVKPSGKLSRQDYLYQLLIDQLITYSDYEYLTGQKPAWSEEDEKMWTDIKSHMVYGSFIPFDKIEWIENRLKFLRPVKQEWSKEDERILTGIIERGSSQIPPTEPALRGEQMEWLMNRLKSLRPSWKPSEEQMDALLVAIHCTPSDENMLISLYNDLKKL